MKKKFIALLLVTLMLFSGVLTSCSDTVEFDEDPAKVYIHNCRFVNGTRDYGGAIYSETFGSVRIRQCQFVECHAKYLGAAVYFQNYRCEQTISGCEVISDQNVQEAFFQNYKEGRQ